MIKNINFRVTDCVLFVYLFMLIYTPPLLAIVNINFNKYFLLNLITIPIFIYYLIKRNNYLKKIILNRNNFKFILGIFISAIYIVVISSVRGYETRFIQNIFLIYQFINVMILIDIFRHRGYTHQRMINIFFNVVLLQSIICILMLLVPSLREIAFKLYYNGGVENIWINKSRIYGVSSDYTYSTPIFHGLVAVTMLIYAIEINWKYAVYIPFVLIAIMLNGRTGIIIFLVGAIFTSLLYILRGRNILRLVLYISGLVIVGILGSIFLEYFANDTYLWIIKGIKEILGFLTEGEKNGTIAALDNALYFPQGIYLFIGEGHRVYGQIGYPHSDIGYVNDLFLGGVIYVVILYCSIFKYNFVKLRKKIIGNLYTVNSIVSFVIFPILLIANYKGECMREGIILTGVFFIKGILINEGTYRVEIKNIDK